MKSPCPKCLFSELDPENYMRTVRAYVEALPESEKTDKATYEMRLQICRNCDSLVDGMCRKCGCFVEVRAAKRALGCPSERNYWSGIKTSE